jgi:hypothetical protein
VVPEKTKNEVLERLAASERPFEAVADLCEMVARRDPALARLAANEGEVRIAACYPRAVRWLFSAAGVSLPGEGVQILNMRVESAASVAEALLAPPIPLSEEGSSS